jgi:predicted transglutaminase-like cysteine proteinase
VANGLQQTDQMAQLPNETLRIKMGDCEDFAVLLTSMIRAYFSNQFLVECIWITGENAGHVAVVIPFNGDQIVILDPIRDYYSHTTLGNMWYNTISSEIYNWMQIWRPSLGNDVHVYRVFSDYVDKYFNGTEEYINWMYNR